jgi:hypothetical protein
MLFIQSCRQDISCDELFSIKSNDPNRNEVVSVEKIIDGYNMKIENRFDFKCIYFNEKDISNYVNNERTDDEHISIKLLYPQKYRLKNNDTLKILFIDNRKFIPLCVATKLVNLIAEKEETPCDTVFNIFYKDISMKIDSVYTNQSIGVKQLFDLTLQNKIKKYISSLSKIDEIRFDECQKEFFILDLINDDLEKFGFVENEYYLTESLKQYLNIITESIAFDIRQHDWNAESQFIIKCIGYADIQRYTGIQKIDYSKLGILDADAEISNTGCAENGIFEQLHERNSLLDKLNFVLNNCDLSILRAYSAAIYIEKRLKDLTNCQFTLQYKGGGEIIEGEYTLNRKIDISIEIKAISKK